MASRMRRGPGRSGGRNRNGGDQSYRRFGDDNASRRMGADSPNWRDRSEPQIQPQARISPSDHKSLHEKYIEYLQKEWKQVENLLKQGRAVTYNPGDWTPADLPSKPFDPKELFGN